VMKTDLVDRKNLDDLKNIKIGGTLFYILLKKNGG
jgi:hypothetical protein